MLCGFQMQTVYLFKKESWIWILVCSVFHVNCLEFRILWLIIVTPCVIIMREPGRHQETLMLLLYYCYIFNSLPYFLF